MDEKERYERGLKVRRSVLGDAYVDAALAKRTPFTEDFQTYLTRFAWGDIWDRPGLPRHTKSLLTIAMLVALDRPDELRLHLRAAKNNGVTWDEIKEVLLHSVVYCGVPAANAAFHLAAEEMASDQGTSA